MHSVLGPTTPKSLQVTQPEELHFMFGTNQKDLCFMDFFSSFSHELKCQASDRNSAVQNELGPWTTEYP